MEHSQMQERYPQQYRVLRQLQADLVQVKGWQHIETRENADLGLCYLYGWVGSSSTEGEMPQIVIPCSTHEPLCMARMTSLLAHLADTSTGQAKPQLTLGFVSNDSSLVYYRLTAGLATPQP